MGISAILSVTFCTPVTARATATIQVLRTETPSSRSTFSSVRMRLR